MNAKAQNIFTFFPTYTQLLENQINEHFFNKTITVNHDLGEDRKYSTIPHSEEKLSYERKKLAPLRKPKGSKREQGSQNCGHISFLSVEKM